MVLYRTERIVFNWDTMTHFVLYCNCHFISVPELETDASHFTVKWDACSLEYDNGTLTWMSQDFSRYNREYTAHVAVWGNYSRLWYWGGNYWICHTRGIIVTGARIQEWFRPVGEEGEPHRNRLAKTRSEGLFQLPPPLPQ